jgi:hypothetical protein
MEGPIKTRAPVKRPAMPEMHPDPRGFIPKYFLALSPLLIVAVSLVISIVLLGYLEGFGSSLNGPLRNMLTGMYELMRISVLLAAPVGVYITFIAIGWMARLNEIWAGSSLALGLSVLGGLLLVLLTPDPTMSPLMDLLTWIAYLILPASIATALVLVVWAEKLRRSIRYRLTGEGILTTGGVWRHREHLLPYHQIGRLVLEQDPIGRLLHVGTVVAVGPDPGGSPAGGRKGVSGAGVQSSRHPLDCLYGIRDPEKVMALLEQVISLSVETEEGQPRPSEGSVGGLDPPSVPGSRQ